MIKEYEIVKSLEKLNDNVPKYCRGTVLMVYNQIPLAYEVEFVNEENETLDVLTVKADQIVKL